MVERQGGGNAAGVIRVTPAANYPANVTVHRRRAVPLPAMPTHSVHPRTIICLSGIFHRTRRQIEPRTRCRQPDFLAYLRAGWARLLANRHRRPGGTTKGPIRTRSRRRRLPENTDALDNINKIIQCVRDIDNPHGIAILDTWQKSDLPAQIQAMAYLYKSDAYRYENECRIVRLSKEPQANNSQIEFIGHPLRGTTTRYLEIPALSTDPNNGMFRSGSVITLGPLVPNPIHTKQDIVELLHRAKLYGPQVRLSEINYKGNSG